MGKKVHEVDVVSNVDPVQGDVCQQFSHTDLLKIVVLFLEQTAVGGDCVDDSGHLNIF